MKTLAAVARAPGKTLSVETVEIDGPKAGEVMVEVKATGICHTDEYTLSEADPEGLFPAILACGQKIKTAGKTRGYPIPA
jgi:S-(hydroxymethyl)glutathione dehydrogenase/alcohol dehydrogenase